MGSIKDKTAIMGVGCTKFGELWEKDAEDLIVEAAYEALDDAGVTPDDIEATWVGNLYDFTGLSGSVAAEPLKLFGKPTTRVENFCASGMDAFRNACLAVASGVYDVVLACGVEKLMDVGGSGLPVDMGHPVMRGGPRRTWPTSPSRTTRTARFTPRPTSAVPSPWRRRSTPP
jgi:acetyl-CoA C-acetyltransferase